LPSKVMEDLMRFAAIDGGVDANDESATKSNADITIDLCIVDGLLTARCIQAIQSQLYLVKRTR